MPEHARARILLKTVWPDAFVEEGNLSQNIFALRKAFGDTPEERRYIVTLPGRTGTGRQLTDCGFACHCDALNSLHPDPAQIHHQVAVQGPDVDDELAVVVLFRDPALDALEGTRIPANLDSSDSGRHFFCA